MHDVSWVWTGALAGLVVIGLATTMVLWRRRGAATGIRMFALTLLPVAAWLLRAEHLADNIGTAIADWVRQLPADNYTWAGLGVFGASIVLYLVGAFLRSRGIARKRRGQKLTRPQVVVPSQPTEPMRAERDAGDVEDTIMLPGWQVSR